MVVAPSVDEARSSMQEAMSRMAEACFSGRGTDAALHDDLVIAVSLPPHSSFTIKFCVIKITTKPTHKPKTHCLAKQTYVDFF